MKLIFFASKKYGLEYAAGIKNGFHCVKKIKKYRFMEKSSNYGKIQLQLWINVIRRFDVTVYW